MVGIVTGWRGQGEMTRATMARIASECRLPSTVLPAELSGHAHASRAMRFLTTDYNVLRLGKAPGARERWSVRRKSDGGDAATVVITPAGDLRIDGADRDLNVRIRGEWGRLKDEEAYPPGDVTLWIQRVLREQYGGVNMALNNWYVPIAGAGAALAFVRAVAATGWGVWQPPLQQRADDDLRRALAGAFAHEVDEVRRLLGYARQEAASRGRALGAEATARFADDLRAVAVRALRYRRDTGTPVDGVRAAVVELADEMDPGSSSVLWADAEIVAGL